jgi:hypothetical protein
MEKSIIFLMVFIFCSLLLCCSSIFFILNSLINSQKTNTTQKISTSVDFNSNLLTNKISITQIESVDLSINGIQKLPDIIDRSNFFMYHNKLFHSDKSLTFDWTYVNDINPFLFFYYYTGPTSTKDNPKTITIILDRTQNPAQFDLTSSLDFKQDTMCTVLAIFPNRDSLTKISPISKLNEITVEGNTINFP